MTDAPSTKEKEKRPESPMRKFWREKTPDERMLIRLKSAAYRAEGYTGFLMKVQDGKDPPGMYMLKDAKRYPVDTDPENMPKEVAERFKALAEKRGIDPETGKRRDGKPNPDFTKRRRKGPGHDRPRLTRPKRQAGQHDDGKKPDDNVARITRSLEPLGGPEILKVIAAIEKQHPGLLSALASALADGQELPGMDDKAPAAPDANKAPAAAKSRPTAPAAAN